MPCRDDGPTPSEMSMMASYDNKINKLEAMLCAVLTSVRTISGSDVDLVKKLEQFDANEAGVNVNDILVWWQDHQKRDTIRRAREREDRIRRRDRVLASMTELDRSIFLDKTLPPLTER